MPRKNKPIISSYMDEATHRAVRAKMSQLGVTWEFVLNQSLAQWLESMDAPKANDKYDRLSNLERRVDALENPRPGPLTPPGSSLLDTPNMRRKGISK